MNPVYCDDSAKNPPEFRRVSEKEYPNIILTI
jgi:hypothetical protein